MAKEEEKEEEAQEELSDEQRIARLEKKVGTNKIVLLSIVLFLIIVITIFFTMLSIHFINKSDDADQPANAALLQEILDLKQQVEEQNAQVKTFSFRISEAEGKLVNSSNAVIQSVMIEQEKGNQKFLSTLRSGVYDLAHMVPGSRTWLELYSEQIDLTLEHSKAREQSLKKLKTSEPASPEDPFFGDEF